MNIPYDIIYYITDFDPMILCKPYPNIPIPKKYLTFEMARICATESQLIVLRHVLEKIRLTESEMEILFDIAIAQNNKTLVYTLLPYTNMRWYCVCDYFIRSIEKNDLRMTYHLMNNGVDITYDNNRALVVAHQVQNTYLFNELQNEYYTC